MFFRGVQHQTDHREVPISSAWLQLGRVRWGRFWWVGAIIVFTELCQNRNPKKFSEDLNYGFFVKGIPLSILHHWFEDTMKFTVPRLC